MGQPSLDKNEILLSFGPMKFWLLPEHGSMEFILEPYKGFIYITNMRIMGMRKPNIFSATWHYHAGSEVTFYENFTPEGLVDRLQRIIDKGGFEYFSLDFSEILGYKESRFFWTAEIKAFDECTSKNVLLYLKPLKTFKRLIGDARRKQLLKIKNGEEEKPNVITEKSE